MHKLSILRRAKRADLKILSRCAYRCNQPATRPDVKRGHFNEQGNA